jgi:hypothetical protein
LFLAERECGQSLFPAGCKENVMKRNILALEAITLPLSMAPCAPAQMGMDIFKKPTIAKAFHPVIGKGAAYESTSKESSGPKTRVMEISIVGKENVDGKETFWMEFATTDDKGQQLPGKTLMSLDDFQVHKMIIQMPGGPALEMPFNPAAAHREKIQENTEDWHSVGSETVTVPAGTFDCEHWRNDKAKSDAWTTDKVTPFGMVKPVAGNHTMVLTKILTDVPDRITGPVQKFDPAAMMQQMQQQHQQPRP